ncbi:hypothetical protein TNCV_926371 [Trichonephila clavipes]|nr:hypothetical protein TNCV_926371 [Trichonephila clavipes]
MFWCTVGGISCSNSGRTCRKCTGGRAVGKLGILPNLSVQEVYVCRREMTKFHQILKGYDQLTGDVKITSLQGHFHEESSYFGLPFTSSKASTTVGIDSGLPVWRWRAADNEGWISEKEGTTNNGPHEEKGTINDEPHEERTMNDGLREEEETRNVVPHEEGTMNNGPQEEAGTMSDAPM